MGLERELEVAINLAREAGRVLLQFYSAPADVEWKSGHEPVTAADKAANALIVSGLANAFPEDGLLAEESPDTAARLSQDRLWAIDPMDGTQEFLNRNGEFSVMIGLALGGRAMLGVVYHPTEDRLFYAAEGVGAFLEHRGAPPEQLRVSDTIEPSQMIVAVSRSHRSQKIDAIRAALGIHSEIRSGSVGLKVGLICERRCDLYIHPSPKTRQWDTCAPEALLTQAGGRMTDLYGRPFTYNRADLYNRAGILATNGLSHERILERVTEAFG